MLKKFSTSTYLLLILIILFSNVSASDLRVKTMGQMKLIVRDEDNQLNLYDFGGNPAWLLKDQTKSWLKPVFTSDMVTGDFKRIYDPESSVDVDAVFEGVKIMDENQAFRGLVNYHNLSLNNVYQAIIREPYEEHPFRLADNTTGNINYWGPTVSAEYSRNLYNQKLLMGASLDYLIETGLKDYFPQSRTVYRYAGLGAGIAYIVNSKLTLGTIFKYSHTQEFTECIPPSSNDPRSISVMKFRGEIIGSERIGSMERFTKIAHYHIAFQSSYKPLNFLETALSLQYNFDELDATESRSKPVKDGTWQLSGYEMHWKNRLRTPGVPFIFGFSFDRIYFNDWARHPRYDILLGDDHFSENSVSFGFAYEPQSLPFLIGTEVHFSFQDADKKDYVSQLFEKGHVNGKELKFGGEARLLRNWAVRAGYVYLDKETNPNLLSFSEFLPENRAHVFTFGLGLIQESMESEIYAYVSRQRPTENSANLHRDSLGLLFSMKFYMD